MRSKERGSRNNVSVIHAFAQEYPGIRYKKVSSWNLALKTALNSTMTLFTALPDTSALSRE